MPEIPTIPDEARVALVDAPVSAPEHRAHLQALTAEPDPTFLLAPDPLPTVLHSPAVRPEWWAPGHALVVAMFALAWQMCGHYERELLAGKRASGAVLDRFDRIVDAVPLLNSSVGQIVGMGLGWVALGLLYMGIRKGARDIVLQVVIGLLALAALSAPFVLPGSSGS